MSKKRPYNQRHHERDQSVADVQTHFTRQPQPMLIGIGIAVIVALIGWAILRGFMSDPPPSKSTAQTDAALQVVPSSEGDSPDPQAGSAIQNAPNQSLDNSSSSELQPTGSTDAGAQTSAELFNQTEHGDLTIKVAP